MKRATLYPCVLLKREGTKIQDIFFLQVDYSFAIGHKKFLKEEEETAAHFKTKPRGLLTKNTMVLNGVRFRCGSHSGAARMDQGNKIGKLNKSTVQKEFEKI